MRILVRASSAVWSADGRLRRYFRCGNARVAEPFFHDLLGHIQPLPGHPVVLADRLTAATSPLAAFAGLTVGLLVLRMSRQQAATTPPGTNPATTVLGPLPGRAANGDGHHGPAAVPLLVPGRAAVRDHLRPPATGGGAPARARDDADGVADRDPRLLGDARAIYQTAAARGQRLSQRMLARQLRGHGHRFPNQQLRGIAAAIGLASGRTEGD